MVTEATKAMEDTRFCYGASCTWCGPISEVGNTNEHPAHAALRDRVLYVKNAKGEDRPIKHSDHALPCCPNCGGMLLELEDAKIWWDGVEKYESEGHPGYKAMWQWQRQHKPLCFRNVEVLMKTYENRDRDPRFRTRHG